MNERIRFTKMHGAGNDFVVIDAIGQPVEMTPRLASAIADRHRGIGCDQLLIVEKPDRADVDFRYRIFNANGGEVEHCGNGARCFVRFVRDRGLTSKTEIAVSTMNGLIRPRLEPDGNVTVDMGAPIFDLDRVPFDASGLAPIPVAGDASFGLWPLSLMHGKKVAVGVVSMGNPHAVCVVDDVDRAPVGEDGPVIEAHPRFPRRVNAGFMQIVARDRIRLRVFERGVGETLACGTGACAAVVVGIRRGLLDARVHVETRGGDLTIAWAGADNSVFMTGPAVSVFEGEIDVPRVLASVPESETE